MRHLFLAAVVSLLVASQSNADQILATVNGVNPPTFLPPVSGTQNYGGSLGLNFTVGSNPIQVTGLGVWDSNQDGLFNNDGIPFNAYIYNASGVPVLTELNYTNADAIAPSGYRFRSESLILPAGFQGTVVGEGYWGGELNGNANTGGPGMTFPNVGVTYTGNQFGNYGSYPTNGDSGFYASGNFTFQIVPEPSSMILCGLGAIGLLVAARRRRV